MDFLLPILVFLISTSNQQATGQDILAQNSSVISVETLEKYQNATELSYLYVVQLELKTIRIEEPFGEIEKRLDKLVEMAFVLASYKHRKQAPPSEITTSDSSYNTKITKKRANGELTYIHFVTFAGNEPVLGEVVADDMTLLSVSQISAILRYPLARIVSDRDIEGESATKWWFLVGVIGTGVIIIMIGWFCLFLFYNTCGYMYGAEDGEFLTSTQRIKTQRSLMFLSPEPSQCELGAEQPIGVPSDGSNRSVVTNKPKLNNKKAPRGFRTLSELDGPEPNSSQDIRKAIRDAFREETTVSAFRPTNDTENMDVEKAKRVVRSEKRRRHTKIGPITTTTLATNEQKEKETSEISGASSVETTSIPDYDEFDPSNLPETTLKITKKGKMQTEVEVRSEPESDYGSSLDDEKSKPDEDEERSKARREEHEDVRTRPMTAKRQRTSLFGGSGVSPLPVQPRAWTVYSAGDRVEAFWNNKTMHNHPMPSSPSESGVVEIKSSNSFRCTFVFLTNRTAQYDHSTCPLTTIEASELQGRGPPPSPNLLEEVDAMMFIIIKSTRPYKTRRWPLQQLIGAWETEVPAPRHHHQNVWSAVGGHGREDEPRNDQCRGPTTTTIKTCGQQSADMDGKTSYNDGVPSTRHNRSPCTGRNHLVILMNLGTTSAGAPPPPPGTQ
ncbi:unnamed protein product [Caenorhabditis sp. 36 PRJEB53466]|nr:unnamed protein product [Caenorhabditis sp. 36 PRJEB53466]